MIYSLSALFLPINLHDLRFQQDWRKSPIFFRNVYAVLADIRIVLADLRLSLPGPLQSWKQSWKSVLVTILPERGESIFPMVHSLDYFL